MYEQIRLPMGSQKTRQSLHIRSFFSSSRVLIGQCIHCRWCGGGHRACLRKGVRARARRQVKHCPCRRCPELMSGSFVSLDDSRTVTRSARRPDTLWAFSASWLSNRFNLNVAHCNKKQRRAALPCAGSNDPGAQGGARHPAHGCRQDRTHVRIGSNQSIFGLR